MARTLTIEGIILKRFDLGEADRVMTVFSKEKGKVSVLAKGVKRAKSRKAGSVEVGNVLKMFVAEGANFYILSEVELLSSYSGIKKSLGLLKYCYHVLEILDAMTVEGEEDIEVYNLTVKLFNLLQQNPRKIFVRAYEAKLLQALGFLSLQEGQEKNVLGYGYLDEESLRIVRDLMRKKWEEIGEMQLLEEQSERIEQFLTFRIERVIERSLRSKQVFE